MSLTNNFNRLLVLACLSTLIVGCGLAINNQDRVIRGEQAMAEGDYRTAIIDSKAVLLEESDNVAARLLLGRASARSGDAATAEVELRKAIALGARLEDVAVDLGSALLILQKNEDLLNEITLDLQVPENDVEDVYMLRGQSLLELNRYDDARQLFGTVLQKNDENIDAQLGIVATYIEEGNLSQARDTLQFVLDSHGEIIAPWLTSANLAKMTRNFPRAESDFAHALGLATTQENELGIFQARLGLGDILLSQNKLDESREVLAALETSTPDAIGTREFAARLALADQDWTTAQENLQAILRVAPDHRPAQFMLGTVHMQNGNLAQAEMYLSAVVAAVPSYADARRNLAETRYRLDQSQSARETLRPLLDSPTADLRSLGAAASASLAAGDFDNAAEFLSRAVEADPSNLDSQLDLAVAYLMANRLEEADGILDMVDDSASEENRLRRDVMQTLSLARTGEVSDALNMARDMSANWPDRLTVLNLLGALELTEGNLTAARANFEAANALAPEALMPKRYLAAVDENEGLMDAAKGRHRAILDANPKDMSSLLAMARLSWREEDYLSAQTWLEKTIETDPANAGSRQLLGRLHLFARNFADAKIVANDAIAAMPDDASHYALLGYAQMNLGELNEATASFERAAQLAPDQPQYGLDIARARLAQGDKEGSIATLEETHNESPEDLSVAIMFASLRVESGDLDSAMEIAKKMQSVHPDDPLPILLESEILVRDGKMRDAADLYDVVLGMDSQSQYAVRAYQIRSSAGLEDKTKPLRTHLENRPLDNEVRNFLGQVYQQDGQNRQAIEELEKVLEIAPANHVAANNLAWIYFLEKDPRAETAARTAHSLAPDNDSILDTLGWILIKNGKAQEGVALLRNAVSKSGGRPEIRYHLAAGLVELGQRDEASTILSEIVQGKDAFASREDAKALLGTL